jgi:hypothetical protein
VDIHAATDYVPILYLSRCFCQRGKRIKKWLLCGLDASSAVPPIIGNLASENS